MSGSMQTSQKGSVSRDCMDSKTCKPQKHCPADVSVAKKLWMKLKEEERSGMKARRVKQKQN
jgi:hypothetical protein